MVNPADGIEPNNWIRLSNSILKDITRIESQLTQKTPFHKLKLPNVIAKLEELFILIGLEPKVATASTLHLLQQEFIRNFIKWVIIIRILSTQWSTTTFLTSSLELSRDLRDNLRELINDRKNLETCLHLKHQPSHASKLNVISNYNRSRVLRKISEKRNSPSFKMDTSSDFTMPELESDTSFRRRGSCSSDIAHKDLLKKKINNQRYDMNLSYSSQTDNSSDSSSNNLISLIMSPDDDPKLKNILETISDGSTDLNSDTNSSKMFNKKSKLNHSLKRVKDVLPPRPKIPSLAPAAPKPQDSISYAKPIILQKPPNFRILTSSAPSLSTQYKEKETVKLNSSILEGKNEDFINETHLINEECSFMLGSYPSRTQGSSIILQPNFNSPHSTICSNYGYHTPLYKSMNELSPDNRGESINNLCYDWEEYQEVVNKLGSVDCLIEYPTPAGLRNPGLSRNILKLILDNYSSQPLHQMENLFSNLTNKTFPFSDQLEDLSQGISNFMAILDSLTVNQSKSQYFDDPDHLSNLISDLNLCKTNLYSKLDNFTIKLHNYYTKPTLKLRSSLLLTLKSTIKSYQELLEFSCHLLNDVNFMYKLTYELELFISDSNSNDMYQFQKNLKEFTLIQDSSKTDHKNQGKQIIEEFTQAHKLRSKSIDTSNEIILSRLISYNNNKSYPSKVIKDLLGGSSANYTETSFENSFDILKNTNETCSIHHIKNDSLPYQSERVGKTVSSFTQTTPPDRSDIDKNHFKKHQNEISAMIIKSSSSEASPSTSEIIKKGPPQKSVLIQDNDEAIFMEEPDQFDSNIFDQKNRTRTKSNYTPKVSNSNRNMTLRLKLNKSTSLNFRSYYTTKISPPPQFPASQIVAWSVSPSGNDLGFVITEIEREKDSIKKPPYRRARSFVQLKNKRFFVEPRAMKSIYANQPDLRFNRRNTKLRSPSIDEISSPITESNRTSSIPDVSTREMRSVNNSLIYHKPKNHNIRNVKSFSYLPNSKPSRERLNKNPRVLTKSLILKTSLTPGIKDDDIVYDTTSSSNWDQTSSPNPCSEVSSGHDSGLEDDDGLDQNILTGLCTKKSHHSIVNLEKDKIYEEKSIMKTRRISVVKLQDTSNNRNSFQSFSSLIIGGETVKKDHDNSYYSDPEDYSFRDTCDSNCSQDKASTQSSFSSNKELHLWKKKLCDINSSFDDIDLVLSRASNPDTLGSRSLHNRHSRQSGPSIINETSSINDQTSNCESEPLSPNKPQVVKLVDSKPEKQIPLSTNLNNEIKITPSQNPPPSDNSLSNSKSDLNLETSKERRESNAKTRWRQIFVSIRQLKNPKGDIIFIAPHGVEYLAHDPIPLNPYYAGRNLPAQTKPRHRFRRGSSFSSIASQGSFLNIFKDSSYEGGVSTSRKSSNDPSTGDASRKNSIPKVHSGSPNQNSANNTRNNSAVSNPNNSPQSKPSSPGSKPNSPGSKESKTNFDSRCSSGVSSEVEESMKKFLSYSYKESDLLIKDGLIVQATIEALIERLTLHDESVDSKFLETFMLTFRSFIKPEEFLELLITRYNIEPPEDLTPDELKVWTSLKLTTVRIRVNNILKTWLESYFYESDDGGCLKRLLEFCSLQMMDTMPSAAKRILSTAGEIYEKLKMESSTCKLTKSKNMDLKAAAAMAKLPNFPPPSPNMPRGLAKSLLSGLSFRITDLDPLEVARQLTIMDYNDFSAIRPHELIGLEFSKKSSTSTQFVRKMTDATNQITSLICECILFEGDIKRRVNIIKYFIMLGENCLLLKNYNSLMPVVGALNSSMIARLKNTWALLPPKFKAVFDQLRKSTDHSRNYAEYRNVLKVSAPPCLPFLGIYLTDLTFTDEGNAGTKSGQDVTSIQINFIKYYQTVAIIQQIQKFQVPYNLIGIKQLQDRLKLWLNTSHNNWDEDALYQRSLDLEPRGGKALKLSSKPDRRKSLTTNLQKSTGVDLTTKAYF